jgi:hypothetical protein
MTARIKNIAFALLLVSGLIQFHFAYVAYAQTTAPESAVNPGTSRNWAGYVADSGTYTSVSGSWRVPGPSAAVNGSDAAWVGIGGVHSRDLIQAGTQAIVQDGQIQYSAWFEALPGLEHTIPISVSAGDTILASLVETSPGEWHIHMYDSTNGQTFDKDIAYTSSHSSAEWIEEQPTGVGFSLALDSFGSASFTGGTATLNGATVSIEGAGAHALQMANDNNDTVATVSSLGADGSSFSVSRTGAASSGGTQMSVRRSFQRTGGYYSRSRYRGYHIYVVQGADGFHLYLAQ